MDAMILHRAPWKRAMKKKAQKLKGMGHSGKGRFVTKMGFF